MDTRMAVKVTFLNTLSRQVVKGDSEGWLYERERPWYVEFLERFCEMLTSYFAAIVLVFLRGKFKRPFVMLLLSCLRIDVPTLIKDVCIAMDNF